MPHIPAQLSCQLDEDTGNIFSSWQHPLPVDRAVADQELLRQPSSLPNVSTPAVLVSGTGAGLVACLAPVLVPAGTNVVVVPQMTSLRNVD